MRPREKTIANGTQVLLTAVPGLEVLCVVSRSKVIGKRRCVYVSPVKGEGAAFVPVSAVRAVVKGGC